MRVLKIRRSVVATVLSAKRSPLRDVDRGSSKYFFIADNSAVKDGNRLASKRRTSLSDSCMLQQEWLNSPAAAVGFLPLEARLQLLLSQLAVQPHLQLKDYLWIAAFWDR